MLKNANLETGIALPPIVKSAFCAMASAFKKTDAQSVLVVDKTWDEIIDKPDFFNELAYRIVQMYDGANTVGQAKPSTKFNEFKDMVNTILLTPLKTLWRQEETVAIQKDNTILVDAFWDEILKTEEAWYKLKEAVAKAYAIKHQIEEHETFKDSDKYQQVKDKFNETVTQPLLGISEPE